MRYSTLSTPLDLTRSRGSGLGQHDTQGAVAGERSRCTTTGNAIAGNSLAAVKTVAGFAWSPWLELGIVALYPAVLLAAGAWLLVRRDA
jgi:hypothetical protein